MSQSITRGQVKNYLRDSQQSPEQLAKKLKISNMTIRRLLKGKPNDPIPDKYQIIFATSMPNLATEFLSPTATSGFNDILNNLQEDGTRVKDPEDVKNQLEEKLKDPRIDGICLEKVKEIAAIAFSKSASKTERALGLGVLLYVINPLDLVPDALFPIGYLDDFAVVTLALAFIISRRKREKRINGLSF